MKIGEGSFGKVYYPPLKCYHEDEDDRYENGVCKLMDKKDAENEFNKLKLFELDKLDSKFEFHLRQPLLKERKTLCESQTNEYLLFYDYGGITLENMLYKIKNEDGVKEIIVGLKNILQWIVILNKNKIYHLDVRSCNVLVSESNKYILIDYGISYKYINNKSNEKIIDYNCGIPFPVECFFLWKNIINFDIDKFTYIDFDGIYTKELYEKHVNFRIKHNVGSFYFDEFCDYYGGFNIEDINKTRDFLVGLEKEQRIKIILEKYDVFMFGQLLIQLLYTIKYNKIIYSKFDELKKYIKKLITFDIKERYNANEAFNEYVRLFC